MSLLMRYFGWPYRFARGAQGWFDGDLPAAWFSGEASYPPANVYENEDAVVIEFEVPGVPKENMDLVTTDTSVTLKVDRKVEGDIPPEKYYVRERWRGEFGRTVTVPAKVDSGRAVASYRKGILTVTLPKSEEAKSRRIKVQAG